MSSNVFAIIGICPFISLLTHSIASTALLNSIVAFMLSRTGQAPSLRPTLQIIRKTVLTILFVSILPLSTITQFNSTSNQLMLFPL